MANEEQTAKAEEQAAAAATQPSTETQRAEAAVQQDTQAADDAAGATKEETPIERAERERIEKSEAEAEKAQAEQDKEDTTGLKLSQKADAEFRKGASGPDVVIHCPGGKTYQVKADGSFRDEEDARVLGACPRIVGELKDGVNLRAGQVVKGLRLAIRRGNGRVVYSAEVERVEKA